MTPPTKNATLNKLLLEDRAAHEWYRFVLSFPPHLVRDYLERFEIAAGHRVLDPFCGTGTTIVECKKLGVASVGVEANPMAYFSSCVKVDWSADPKALLKHARGIAQAALKELQSQGIRDGLFFQSDSPRATGLRALAPEQTQLLLKDSISPLPLHKTLVLLDCINEHRDARFYNHETLALAKALVGSISNLHFGPEVGVRPPKADAVVVPAWLDCVALIARDLEELRPFSATPAELYQADSRQIADLLEPESIDAVITSPPYPNEKDYTRTMRLESVILGLLKDKADLRALKQGLIRSNTRNVFVADDDDRWVADHPMIERIAQQIEARRIELGKTSGFERLYPRATKLYFGGMVRHLSALRALLRPGACLAYVVGDQASYLQVMIRTGQILAELAQSLGYELVGINLFRTRYATATRQELREEVVMLRWPRRARSSQSDRVCERTRGTEYSKRGRKATRKGRGR